MKKRILVLDCFAGISGDMAVGALLNLGVEFEDLKIKLNNLPLEEYTLSTETVIKNGISALKFNVIEKSHNHDASSKHHHHGAHAHRNFNDIKKIISESSFSDYVKSLAGKIFLIIAQAEAKVHNKTIDDVHFHEVGAIDSIVDILSFAYCVDQLNIDKIYSSSISLGKGFVHCDHGKIPVPVPATVEILKDVPVKFTEIPKELTTPTGAGIIKAAVTGFNISSEFKIIKTAYGAGTRELEIPNVLRAMLVEELVDTHEYTELVTNIDDMNPEIYSYLFEKLFTGGALDVFTESINMKKNRPALKLSVLCYSKDAARFEKIIFEETSTFGIRKHQVARSQLERKIIDVQCDYGVIKVKAGYFDGKIIKYSPEYDDCKNAAQRYTVPLQKVYESVLLACKIKN